MTVILSNNSVGPDQSYGTFKKPSGRVFLRDPLRPMIGTAAVSERRLLASRVTAAATDTEQNIFAAGSGVLGAA